MKSVSREPVAIRRPDAAPFPPVAAATAAGRAAGPGALAAGLGCGFGCAWGWRSLMAALAGAPVVAAAVPAAILPPQLLQNRFLSGFSVPHVGHATGMAGYP